MKNCRKYLSILIVVLVSCNKNDKVEIKNNVQAEGIVNTQLGIILDEYIENNPTKFIREKGKSVYESGFSYPSYNLYFKEFATDTILSIIQSSSYNNTELVGVYNEKENEVTYHTMKHKGWLMYKGKYPLIIFDDNDYSSKLLESSKLLYEIPDSLRAGNNNRHIKFNKWDYKLKNEKFTRTELMGTIHAHPSQN